MRKTSLSALLLISGLVLGALAAEAALRIIPGFSFDDMTAGFDRVPDRRSFAEYRLSPDLGYELIPNAKGDINSFGMRDREYPLRKEAGVFRILLLGDSIAEMEKWPEMIETDLNRTRRTEVLNGAVKGWGLYQYRRYLETRGLKFEPDLVLVSLCLNDMDSGLLSRVFLFDERRNEYVFFTPAASDRPGVSSSAAFSPSLFRRSALYRLYVRRFVAGRSARLSREAAAGIENQALGQLLAMKKLTGGRLAAIVFSYVKHYADYAPLEIEQYQMTVRLLKKAGIRHLDLVSKLPAFGKDIESLRYRPLDTIHLNEKGDMIAADMISKWLSGLK